MRWETEAACAGMDTEIFFPARDDRVAIEKARLICDRCPVADECLDEHMRMPDAVVGGTSWAERRWMIRQARKSAS